MYPIHKLTAFNHALVYGFDPEDLPQKIFEEPSVEDWLFQEAEQHVDILNAYLYAQDEILPQIKEQGIEKITPSQLLEWLLTLHKHIGKSLLASLGEPSGQYASGEITRWQQNAESSSDILSFINELYFSEQAAASFIKNYSAKHELSKKTCSVFTDIVKRCLQESIPELSPLPRFGQRNLELVIKVIEKIQLVSRNGTLSKEEQQELNKILVFGTPPKEIPDAMQQFARNTVKTWHSLSGKTDVAEIANTISELFYQLTHIHPFGNCNGRTATCLTNIILKSLGLPDIILRYPNERNDAESDYGKAMAVIMETREPFAKHIFSCIKRAQNQPFKDEALAYGVELKVSIGLKYQQLQKNPAFNKSAFLRNVEKLVHFINEENHLAYLKGTLKLIEETDLGLTQASKSSLTTFPVNLNPVALYKEALNHYKAQQYDLAIKNLQQAIEGFQLKKQLSPQIATCYSTLASTYRDKKEYNLAIAAAEKAFVCQEELTLDTRDIQCQSKA